MEERRESYLVNDLRFNQTLTTCIIDAFTDDDPFFSEVSNFIDCIEGGPDPHILSSFEDATKTYE